jgi:hypothetical protein
LVDGVTVIEWIKADKSDTAKATANAKTKAKAGSSLRSE